MGGKYRAGYRLRAGRMQTDLGRVAILDRLGYPVGQNRRDHFAGLSGGQMFAQNAPLVPNQNDHHDVEDRQDQQPDRMGV